jgi:hypothetical protein
MRHEPIEIGLAGKIARRKTAQRMLRIMAATRRSPNEAVDCTPATNARDEAFAGLEHATSRSNRLAVLSQLNEQLTALDRQREQLATLLREIETAALAD